MLKTSYDVNYFPNGSKNHARISEASNVVITFYLTFYITPRIAYHILFHLAC